MSSNATGARLNITAISVSAETGLALRHISEAVGHITIAMPHLRPFDGSQVLFAGCQVASAASAMCSPLSYSYSRHEGGQRATVDHNLRQARQHVQHRAAIEYFSA